MKEPNDYKYQFTFVADATQETTWPLPIPVLKDQAKITATLRAATQSALRAFEAKLKK